MTPTNSSEKKTGDDWLHAYHIRIEGTDFAMGCFFVMIGLFAIACAL